MALTASFIRLHGKWGRSILSCSAPLSSTLTSRHTPDLATSLRCMVDRVVVKGGHRMLARAPTGTKRWHIWASFEELQARKLQQQRRAQEGREGTWLVDRGGALLR